MIQDKNDNGSAVDFRSLVRFALDQKVSWTKLKSFLDDLASTFETSKKLNDVLLDELQALHSKMMNYQTQEKAKETESEEQETHENEVMVLSTNQKIIDNDFKFVEGNTIVENSEGFDDYVDESLPIDSTDFSVNEDDDNEFTEFDNETYNHHENEYNDKKSGQSKSSLNDKTNDRNVEKGLKNYSECFDNEKKNASMKSRKLIIIDGTRYSCKRCGQVFKTPSNLIKHERIHGGEKIFECRHCQKKYNTKQRLQIHERIHTGERPYGCNTCHKNFKSQYELKLHERIHSREKPFECGHCQKKFNTTQKLKRHERIHTGERPYDCNTCHKMFKSQYQLKVHVRIHTGEKPYVCHLCKKSFAHNRTLKSHERVHSS